MCYAGYDQAISSSFPVVITGCFRQFLDRSFTVLVLSTEREFRNFKLTVSELFQFTWTKFTCKHEFRYFTVLIHKFFVEVTSRKVVGVVRLLTNKSPKNPYY